MGEGARRREDGGDRCQERFARCGGAHRPNQDEPEHDQCKRLPMPRLDAHGRVDQLVRQDRGDLRRHGVGRVGQVRPDEDFKVPVRAAPVIPALADRPAPTARACKADRHPHPLAEGSAQRLEQWRHARRHPIQALAERIGAAPFLRRLARFRTCMSSIMRCGSGVIGGSCVR